MPKDNWKHRSEGMRCATCMHFATKPPCTTLGRCRKHAPTMTGFPAVFDTDWCGDHKLDETKIEGPPTISSHYTTADPSHSFLACEECGFLIPFDPDYVLEHDDFKCIACLHVTRLELGKNRLFKGGKI